LSRIATAGGTPTDLVELAERTAKDIARDLDAERVPDTNYVVFFSASLERYLLVTDGSDAARDALKHALEQPSGESEHLPFTRMHQALDRYHSSLGSGPDSPAYSEALYHLLSHAPVRLYAAHDAQRGIHAAPCIEVELRTDGAARRKRRSDDYSGRNSF